MNGVATSCCVTVLHQQRQQSVKHLCQDNARPVEPNSGEVISDRPASRSKCSTVVEHGRVVVKPHSPTSEPEFETAS